MCTRDSLKGGGWTNRVANTRRASYYRKDHIQSTQWHWIWLDTANCQLDVSLDTQRREKLAPWVHGSSHVIKVIWNYLATLVDFLPTFGFAHRTQEHLLIHENKSLVASGMSVPTTAPVSALCQPPLFQSSLFAPYFGTCLLQKICVNYFKVFQFAMLLFSFEIWSLFCKISSERDNQGIKLTSPEVIKKQLPFSNSWIHVIRSGVNPQF